jgi:tetratricopeptide (TPR) repeat protein
MSAGSAAEAGAGGLHPITDLPLVGRDNELEMLRLGLRQARDGYGSAWSLIGPGGIGKSRILRTLETDALQLGLNVRWGLCLKEALAPFLPFEQIFRGASGEGTARASGGPQTPAGTTFLYEEERPRRSMARAVSLGSAHPLLVIGRDRPTALRQKFPELPTASELLWLTRNEGPECISPGSIDGLGERIDTFLKSHPGGVVALTGLEYLISQNGFLPILRLVQMLRDVTESSDGTLLLAVHAATLDDRERSLLEAEGEVIRDAPQGLAETAGAASEPPALRLLRYLETLRAEASEKPQLLLLDDLQWSDPQSRTALQFLARNCRDLPVMIVGALRAEEGGDSDAPGDDRLSEVLDHLEQEGILRPIRLGGLRVSDAGGLVQGMLGVPLAVGKSDQGFLDILQTTGGNPYFLLESLQHLLEQGFLRKDGNHAVLVLPKVQEGSDESAVPIPPTIRRLVSRRLESLSESDRHFLEVAAVAGSEFDLPPVVSVVGIHPPEGEETARRLVRRLRLLAPAERPDAYEFAHPLVWEVLRESIEPADERRIASELARWWERERKEDAETIARLYHTARQRDPGLTWVQTALDRAVAAKAPGVVFRYLAWRRDLLSDSPEDQARRAEVEIPLTVRLHREGAGAPARQLADDLVKLSLTPPLRWEAALAHLIVNYDVGTAGTAATLPELVRELNSGRAPVPPDLWGRVRHAEAVIALQEGRWAESAEASAKIRALPEDRLDLDTRVAGLVVEAFALREVGRMPEALQRLDEAKELLPRCRISETGIRLYNTEGAVRFAVGDLRGAQRAVGQAIERAHAAGNVLLEIMYLGNAANITWTIGDYPTALKMCDDGISLAQKFAFERGIHNIRRVRCSLVADMGRIEEGERDLKESFAWMTKAGQKLNAAECQMSLANLKGRRGDVAGALEDFREVEEHYAKMGPAMMAEFRADRARWRALAGDLAGAREDLVKATEDKDEMRNPCFRQRLEIARHEVELAAGDKAKAREALKSAIETMRQIGAIAYRGTTLAQLEQRLEALG